MCNKSIICGVLFAPGAITFYEGGVGVHFMELCTRYNIMGKCLSVVFSGFSVSLSKKKDRHNITEILMIVALNTINNKPNMVDIYTSP
jgi:hypothetical protein